MAIWQRVVKMVRLVVWVGDSEGTHDYGDVVSWRKEGDKNIGTKTMQDPRFKVVHIPNMTEMQAISLESPQPGYGKIPQANPNLKYRAQTFNIAALTGATRAQVDLPHKVPSDKFRVEQDGKVTMLDVDNVRIDNLSEALAVVETKPIINVTDIGGDEVIG